MQRLDRATLLDVEADPVSWLARQLVFPRH
jgi:hypothetical protein